MIDVRGKTLVLTGDFGTYKRAEAEALLQARGARCSGSVSKKTDLVFAGMGAGSKLDKARALGVPVYDEAALVATLKEPVAADTVTADSQSAKAAAPAVASPTATGPGNGVFLADSDWSALREPDTAMAALRRADWSALAVQRDVPRLRAALASHPSPGEAHVAATAALRARGAQLVHCRPHFTEMVSFALSPDGQHLASGAWVGDDYDRGATLALWEVAAGRCVRVIDPIAGGVGWPEYERQLQFSRDGKLLGVGVNTNGVGLWDAFGASPDSLGEAYITDGWSRPPAWCLSPEGTRAFISCWVGAEVPGAIVALVSDTRRRVSAWGHRAVKPLPMAKKLPKAVKDKINDKDPGIQPYKFVRWSDDGSRVYGHNNHNQGFAIDVKSGSILWLTTLHAPVAWSPDGKWIAHCPAGLVFYDGTTGLPTLELPMHVGPEALYFALRGATARLASLVCANNQFAAEPGVFLYTDGKFVEGLDARPQPRRWDDGELAAWAWSADGTCGVLLNDAGALEHWDLSGARGQKLATWPSFEGARGVLYADGVIVVVSRARICFVRASDGAVLGDHDQLREPRTERPLELDGVDLGADLRPDPTFNLDADTWAVAFAGGAVIAPSGRRAELDARLAWVLERRVAWPTAWGELTVLPSASAAAGHAGVPQELPLDRFPSSPAPAAATFPPENEVSDDELFSLAVNSVARLSPGWSSHVSDNLSLVSRLRARRGEHAAAQAVVTAIPEPLSRMVATACWATIAAGRGDPAAQTALTLLEAMNLDALDEKSVPWVAAALGAAFHASRRDSQARFWFARAEQSIEPEVNGWQKRLALAWAYTEAGLDERAAALWADAAVWQSAPSSFYYEPWFAYLVRTERDAVLAAFLKRWKKAGSLDFQVQWFVPTLYAQRGRAAGLSAIAKVLGVKVRDEDRALCKRRRVGTRVVPSADDIAALVRSYDEIQSLPRARRAHPMRELAERCATLGHFGAARALLLQLDDTDMNNRPGAAFRILYCAMTGSMTDPW